MESPNIRDKDRRKAAPNMISDRLADEKLALDCGESRHEGLARHFNLSIASGSWRRSRLAGSTWPAFNVLHEQVENIIED